MAKKKTEERSIEIKNPKPGNQYYFLFAGGVLKGTLGDRIPSLEATYNENWYKLIVLERGREMRYPIPQKHLSNSYENLIKKS